MPEVRIVGTALERGAAAFARAGAAFEAAGSVSIGADTGSAEVSEALGGLAEALRSATSACAGVAGARNRFAEETRSAFTELDGALAAAAAGGAGRG